LHAQIFTSQKWNLKNDIRSGITVVLTDTRAVNFVNVEAEIGSAFDPF